jgi:uncharacterized protein
VQLQVRTLDGFRPRAEQEWPLARTRWTRLYLDAGRQGLSLQRPGTEQYVSYRADGDGVTFTGAPLARETEITGPVAACLFVSSTVPGADLFLILRVFAPSGAECVFRGAIDPHTPIAQGWLRLSHRRLDPDLSTEQRPYHPHDEVQPVVPGQVYQADIEIWPTSLVIPAGYRVALTVRGRDYEHHHPGGVRLATFSGDMTGCGPFRHDDPRDRPPAITGSSQTLWAGGARDAYLLLPVIPPD